MDTLGGYSEQTKEVIVNKAAQIDVSKLTESFSLLVGEQNVDELVALASAISDTLGLEKSPEQQALTQDMTSSVSILRDEY